LKNERGLKKELGRLETERQEEEERQARAQELRAQAERLITAGGYPAAFASLGEAAELSKNNAASHLSITALLKSAKAEFAQVVKAQAVDCASADDFIQAFLVFDNAVVHDSANEELQSLRVRALRQMVVQETAKAEALVQEARSGFEAAQRLHSQGRQESSSKALIAALNLYQNCIDQFKDVLAVFGVPRKHDPANEALTRRCTEVEEDLSEAINQKASARTELVSNYPSVAGRKHPEEAKYWFLCLADVAYCAKPDASTKYDAQFASYEGEYVQCLEIVDNFLKIGHDSGYAKLDHFDLGSINWTWAGVSCNSPDELPCNGYGWYQLDGQKAPDGICLRLASVDRSEIQLTAAGPDQFFEVESKASGHLKLAGTCGYVPDDACIDVGPLLFKEAKCFCYVGSASLDVQKSAPLISPTVRTLSFGDVVRRVQLCRLGGIERMRIDTAEWITYWPKGFVELESMTTFDVHRAPKWPQPIELEIIQRLQQLDACVSLSQQLRELSLQDTQRTTDPNAEATIQFLRNGADPNFPYNKCHSESPLLCAVLYGRLETIKELVRHGASADVVGFTPKSLKELAGDGVCNGSRVGLHQCGQIFRVQKRETVRGTIDGMVDTTCEFNSMCGSCEDNTIAFRQSLLRYFDSDDHRRDSEAGHHHAVRQRESWKHAAEHHWHRQGGLTSRDKMMADHSNRSDGSDNYGNQFPGQVARNVKGQQLSGEGAPVWTKVCGRGRVVTHVRKKVGKDEFVLAFGPKFSSSAEAATARQNPRWVRSHEAAGCMLCEQRFRKTVPKHHCRACGFAVRAAAAVTDEASIFLPATLFTQLFSM
jgi:hypothetical protein